MDVTVFCAESLEKKDVRGLSDAYCVLVLKSPDGRKSKPQKTKWVEENLNPEWNKEMMFTVESLEQEMHVAVYDHDNLGADDLMGNIYIPLAELENGDIVDWFEMKNHDGDNIIGEDGNSSKVKLGLKYTPFPSKEARNLMKPIYDGGVGELVLKDSIKRAAGNMPKKRVLLQLGADWSSSCKRMFTLLSDDPICSAVCAKFFEYVCMDADHPANVPILHKLGDPQWMGFPVFVILDCEGRYLHTQATGALEVDPAITAEEPDTKKVLRFLNYWKEGGANDEAAEGETS